MKKFQYEVWDYEKNPDELKAVIELLKNTKKLVIVRQPGCDGVFVIGDDAESIRQAEIVVEAFNINL